MTPLLLPTWPVPMAGTAPAALGPPPGTPGAAAMMAAPPHASPTHQTTQPSVPLVPAPKAGWMPAPPPPAVATGNTLPTGATSHETADLPAPKAMPRPLPPQRGFFGVKPPRK